MPANSDSTSLDAAIRAGDRAGVGELLQRGVAPQFTFVFDPVVVDLLVDAGADPNAPMASGDRPLDAAASLGRTAVVARLLARGAAVTDAALDAASRRSWSGVARLLAAGPDALRAESLRAGDLAGAPAQVVRIVDEERVLSISFESTLVEWRSTGSGGAVEPARWLALDENRVTWIEVDERSPNRLVLASEDTGPVAVDLETFEIESHDGGFGGSDRGGIRQAVTSGAGGELMVPARRADPWVMQAAWSGGRPLLLRAGPLAGDDPTPEIIEPVAEGEVRVWAEPDRACFVPMAMAVVDRPTGTEAEVLVHDTSDRLQLITAHLGDGSTRRIVPIESPRRRLPSLGSVVADASATYVVAGSTLLRVDADDRSAVRSVPIAAVPNAVDCAAGQLAFAAANGVGVLPL